MKAEQLTDAVAYHGEGPVWDAATQRLLWVDLYAGDVLATAGDGATTRQHVSDLAAVVVPRRAGGYLVATARGFTLLDATGAAEALPDVWRDPSVRMND